MLRRENWPGSSVSPVETWKKKKVPSLQMSLQGGEKGPSTGLLGPGGREGRPATAFFSPLSTYTPPPRGFYGGEEGQPTTTLVPKARVFFFFSPTSVRKRPRRRATALQGREKGRPRISLDRQVERDCQPAHFPPTVEPTLPKNLQSPKWKKKKKSFHNITLVRKLSSRATFLSHRQDEVRAGPRPGFFLSKTRHVQMSRGAKRRVFWSPGICHVTKGQAWACVLESGTPPPRFRNSDTLKALPTLGTCAKFLPPPPAPKLPFRGTPRKHSRKGSEIDASDASGGRASRARAAIFGTTTVLSGN